jgi:hypothetical protein
VNEPWHLHTQQVRISTVEPPGNCGDACYCLMIAIVIKVFNWLQLKQPRALL